MRDAADTLKPSDPVRQLHTRHKDGRSCREKTTAPEDNIVTEFEMTWREVSILSYCTSISASLSSWSLL